MLIPGVRRKEHTVSDERDRVETDRAEDEAEDFEGHRMEDGQIEVGRNEDGQVEVGRNEDGQVEVGRNEDV
jgi:hypothetical protein